MIPTNDQLETARILLGIGLGISNIFVWLGVYLENEKFEKPTQDKGWKILLVALAAEAALAFFLLAADTTISSRQASDVSKLQSKTEKLRTANLLLEAQVQPRRLSVDQQNFLTNVFARFPGNAVRVSSYALDVEGATLGIQILSAANAARLPLDPKLLSDGAIGSVMTGISVTGTNSAMVSNVIAAFGSFGLSPTPNPPPQSAGISIGGQDAPLPLKIFIGVKPLAR